MLNASVGAQIGVVWVILLSAVYSTFSEFSFVGNHGIKSCLRALPNVCGSILARADTNRKTPRGNDYSTFVSFALMLRGIGDFATEFNDTELGFLVGVTLYQASYIVLILLLRREAKHVKAVSPSQFIFFSTSAMLWFFITYSTSGMVNVSKEYQFIVNFQGFLMGITLWRMTTRNLDLGAESYRLSLCGGLLLYLSDVLLGLRRYNGFKILLLLSTMCLHDEPVRPLITSRPDKDQRKNNSKLSRKDKRRRKKAKRN